MKTLYRFDEVLNDLMDYFILGDPDYLLQYKTDQGLPNDLLTEFTTEMTGDIAVENGVIVPLIGIENYPYTVYFNLSDDIPELLKSESQLQHKREGYCLRVENERIYLYTIPYLKDFTQTKVETLKKYKSATIKIPNGWYAVTILGGLTTDILEINTANGDVKRIETKVPTFEFLLKPRTEKPAFAADFSYQFKIVED